MYNPQLETFIRVADAGSFNRAAEQLYITPPAVIKQINLLESELDLRLFVRTHRGLALTEAGKSLYQDAKYVIQYCRDSVERARSAMQQQNAVIRIGSSPLTPAQFLVELWPRIHERCPEIRFQLVPYENTPENAREILRNMGQSIDVVAGIFDETMLKLRQCAGFPISMSPVCCAVSVRSPLARRERLSVRDLYGRNLMLIHRGWNRHVDQLRDDIEQNHPQIRVVDFDFYDMGVFNRCENSDDLLMAVQHWEHAHPLLKILPVEWDHCIPYGLLHAPEPSPPVRRLLDAVRAVLAEEEKQRSCV